jgi:hypothetical protein
MQVPLADSVGTWHAKGLRQNRFFLWDFLIKNVPLPISSAHHIKHDTIRIIVDLLGKDYEFLKLLRTEEFYLLIYNAV